MIKRAFIFPTLGCNLRCPQCYQLNRMVKIDKPLEASCYWEKMDWFKYIKILDKLKGKNLDELVFTGGEPTLWQYLILAIGYAKDFKLAKRVRVLTNGFGRNIKDYGKADVIQVSDYGGINRYDYLRLKRQGGRRVRIQSVVHLKWPFFVEGSSVKKPDCGCLGPAFVGDRIWGCAFAAGTLSKGSVGMDADLSKLTYPAELCKTCLVNLDVRGELIPWPTLQLSFWESRSFVVSLKLNRFRNFYRKLMRIL